MRRGAVILASVATAALLAPLANGETERVILGTANSDRLIGTHRAETIIGYGGGDVVRGRQGADVLRGGVGRDRLVGGTGFDRVRAGRGRDVIRLRDRHRDFADCGDGRDRVVVGRIEDGVYDCERVVGP